MILGIGGFLHDAACAVIRDGKLVAAVEQKKIAKLEHAGQLPLEAMAEALRLARGRGETVQHVAVARPFAAGSESALHIALRGLFPQSRLIVVEHHEAHAASAYFASPFDDAVVLTLDRMGDFRCGVRWRAEGNRLTADRELFYPDSLGDLYGRVTELLGFHRSADEHKVQWLSTAGDRSWAGLFEEILGMANGVDWPRLQTSWFDERRLTRGGFSAKFYQSLGLKDEADIPRSMRANIAAGVQAAVETAVLRMAGDAPRLCLAGGLAFNALLVAALERTRQVFVQPASGNSGTAIGAALYASHVVLGNGERVPMDSMCLGPAYGPEEVKTVLENCKLRFRYLLTAEELIETAVREIHDQKIVAWMQGRMEFGPRALGNRSILASPLNAYSTENLNAYIKHREPFRKFAASVPAELCAEYFEAGPNARFLATVGRVLPKHRKTFESAVLGDNLVRVHTVHENENPLYHRLLLAAGEKSGLPVLYNTSFNLFNDPLVCTPRDAVRSFYSSGIDALFAGNFLIEK